MSSRATRLVYATISPCCSIAECLPLFRHHAAQREQAASKAPPPVFHVLEAAGTSRSAVRYAKVLVLPNAPHLWIAMSGPSS